MKSFFFIAIIFLFSTTIFGQSNYIGIGYGNNFGDFNSYRIPFFYESYYKNENINLAKGSVIFLNYGKELNSNLSLDFAFNYQLENETKYQNAKYNVIYKGYGGLLISSILTKISYDAITPYFKFGIILASLSLELKSNEINSNEYSSELYSGGIDLGLHSAIGIEYKLHSSYTIFTEVRFNSISLNATRLKSTSVLNSGTVSKNYVLADKVSPSEFRLLKTSYPFNTLGILVGVRSYF